MGGGGGRKKKEKMINQFNSGVGMLIWAGFELCTSSTEDVFKEPQPLLGEGRGAGNEHSLIMILEIAQVAF